MRRAARIAGWVLLAVVALVVLLAGGTMWGANTNTGRQLIERGTAWATHGQVMLQGLSGRFPEHLRLQRLMLRDPQGPWLQADDLALDCSPLQLLEWRAHVERLTAAHLAIVRRPAYAANRGDHGAFHLPVTIQIDRLDVPRLELAAALAGNAVALRVQGSGAFASLQQASLQLTAQRLDQVPATYRAFAQLDKQRIQARVDLDEAAGGPLANLIRLPALGALAVHVQLAGPRNALNTLVDAHAGGLQARATGTLDLPGRAATLDLSLQASAMSPRAGLSWQRVVLQGRARGALTAPTTSAHLELAGLVVGALRLDSLKADVRGEGRALGLDAVLDGLSLPGPIHDLLHDAPIRLHGQAQLVRATGAVLDLTLSHPLLDARAHYELGSSGAGTLTAGIPNLAPWAALADLSLQGRGSLQGRLETTGQSRQLALSGDLSVSGGEARWVGLLAPRTALSAALVFDQEGVRLERSQLSSARLQASAHGDDRQGALNVSWQLALPDLTALWPGAVGQLSAQGRVQGTMPRLALAASVDTKFAAHRAPGSIHLTLQALDLPQRPAGRIDVSGSLDHAPLTLAANMQRAANGVLTLVIQRGDWKSAHAEGVLHVGDDVRAPQGQLALRMTSLADLDPLLGQALQGSIDASIAFENPRGRSRARVTVEARDVGVPAQQLTLLQLRGDIDEPLHQPHLALQLSANGLVHGISTKLSATATGPLDRLSLRATATTAGAVDTAAELAAGAIWYGNQRELKLTSFSARYRQQMVHLLAPAQISLRDGISVDQLRVGLGPAVIQAEGRLTPRLDLRASVRNFTPAVLGLVVPRLQGLQAQGRADADLTLQGSVDAPSGTFTLTAGGLGSANGAARGLPPAAIKVRAQLADGAADINVAIDAGKQMQLQASGRVPLHRTVPMAFKLTGRMNLSLVNPILEASGQRLLGELAVEAQLSGTLAAPQARGALTLTKGDLQDYPRGVHISNISGTLEAQGSKLQLTQLSAHAGSGTIAASGSVDLSAPGMPVQLMLTSHNAQPLKSDLLTANLDMNLRVSGALLRHELAASGTVRVNSATINIPNAMPPNVAVLHVIQPGQQAAPPPPPEKPLIAKLDLTVNAPTGIFVRGRGLNAQVGGTVHASGNSSTPSVSGGFDLIRGTFDIAGATLTFTSGKLSFNGTGLHHKIDPTLDFTATTYTGGITATLNVGGYADAPVITLSSMPALPQDEILARLLFGESVSQLSALQIAGIGAALVTMTGVGGSGGFNPLNTVQRALGLNRLVVSGGSSSTTAAAGSTGATSQTNTGATIEAGRYITNRIYIGAKQSTNGLTQAQVQVDLTRQWKLQTTLSSGGGTVQGATPENDPGSSIGMSYQFEF